MENHFRCAVVVLKLLQLTCSIMLVYSISLIGTQWILLMSTLLVPLFGLILQLKQCSLSMRPAYSTDEEWRIHRRFRSSIRADASMTSAMAVLFAALAIILAIAHRILPPAEALLRGCISSLSLCLLYILNATLDFYQLRTAKVHFTSGLLIRLPKSLPSEALGSSPLSLSIDTFEEKSRKALFPSGRLLAIQHKYSTPVPFNIPRVKTHRVHPFSLPSPTVRTPPVLYAIPPSSDAQSVDGLHSSLSSCSIQLGDGYTSASTISQERVSDRDDSSPPPLPSTSPPTKKPLAYDETVIRIDITDTPALSRQDFLRYSPSRRSTLSSS